MRRSTLAVLLSALMLAALLVAPSVAQAQSFTPQTESLSIDTKYGQLYVEVTYPTKGNKPVKGPAVVTLSPYSVLGRSNVAKQWVPEGYVHVWADVIGTGNSGGCYDYGGKRERRTGYELVEWIADQPWSNGKVAMIGGSYNGTTAWATAVEAPPHLTTIVPEAAIARWYDYAYAGGIRYLLNNEDPTDEGFDTPLLFDFGFALPPPTDVQDPNWADKVASTITPCEELTHTERGYDETPDYDKFWTERDYLRDADNIDIPVLIAHNWGDWNVKPDGAYWMYEALKRSNPSKTTFYAGTRWKGHSTPDGDYDKVVRQWFDHYLMGKDNGINKLPSYVGQVADYAGNVGWFKGEPKTRNVTLYAQERPQTFEGDYSWKLLPEKWAPGFLPPTPSGWPIDSPNAESHANHHSRENHEWQYFQSPPLKKDTRVFGEIKVQLYNKIDRTWVTLIPVVLDSNPDCHMRAGNMHVTTPECMQQSAPSSTATPRAVIPVTRGFLDSRYREGLHKQVLVEPGKPFGATVDMKPTDYIFRKGHSVALNVFSSNVEWAVQKFPAATDIDPDCLVSSTSAAECGEIYLEWDTNKVRVVLPVVNPPKNPMDLFDFDHAHH
ncbi:MAG: CocE/NonD family hydrolase [Actinomycetota bacterium]